MRLPVIDTSLPQVAFQKIEITGGHGGTAVRCACEKRCGTVWAPFTSPFLRAADRAAAVRTRARCIGTSSRREYSWVLRGVKLEKRRARHCCGLVAHARRT